MASILCNLKTMFAHSSSASVVASPADDFNMDEICDWWAETDSWAPPAARAPTPHFPNDSPPRVEAQKALTLAARFQNQAANALHRAATPSPRKVVAAVPVGFFMPTQTI